MSAPGLAGWRGTGLADNEAKQRAADMNVMFDQYRNRDQKERREVEPPIPVESATWSAAGLLDYWVRERFEWWALQAGPGVLASSPKTGRASERLGMREQDRLRAPEILLRSSNP